MLELKKGCKVPFPERLSEGYKCKERAIFANVNASKVKDIMRDFILRQKEYILFILEVPTSESDEKKISSDGIKVFHQDVYMMPCREAETALYILEKYGDLLITDGMNLFGFRGDKTKNEITFGKYNVLSIYTKEISAYSEFLEGYGIKQQIPLVTAWQTFSAEFRGESRIEKTETGFSIYDIPDQLKDYGMIFVERRER